MKYLCTLILLLSCAVCSAETPNTKELEAQAIEFFEQYIGVYNSRFGHPERSEDFQAEMARLLYEPLLSAPLNGQPRVMTSRAAYAQNLEAFVAQLENKGVVSLRYDEVQLHVLSPNKILANNTGRGVSESGETLYETISIYFLFRDDERWQIAMLNAYEIDNAMDWK